MLQAQKTRVKAGIETPKTVLDEKRERNRYPLNVFMNKILQWTVEWSQEYKSGAKTFVTVPTIDLPLWTLAYKWLKMNKPIKQNVDKNGLVSYKFAAGETKTLKHGNLSKNSKKDFVWAGKRTSKMRTIGLMVAVLVLRV